MPSVPRYDGPQIKTEPIPGARATALASAEAFGGGASAKEVADTFQGVNKNLMKIFANEKENADDVAVLEAAANMAQRQSDIENEASKMKEKDAAVSLQFATESLEKGYNELSGGLANAEQKAKFREKYLPMKVSTYDTVQKHTTTELEKHDTNTTKSFIENTQNAIALDYRNADKIVRLDNSWKNELWLWARRHGKLGQQFDDLVFGYTSEGHKKNMTRMLIDGDTEYADSYADEFSDEISDNDKSAISAVRAEAAALQKDKDEAFKTSYLRDKNIGTMQAKADRDAGVIDLPTYNSKISMLTTVRDDPSIPYSERLNMTATAIKMYEALAQGEGEGGYDENKGEFTIDITGSSVRPLERFRGFISENLGYFTEKFSDSAIEKTQTNFNHKGPIVDIKARVGFMEDFVNFVEKFTGPIEAAPVGGERISSKEAKNVILFGPAGASAARYIKEKLEESFNLIFDPSVPAENIGKELEKQKESIRKAVNPNYTKYPVGKPFTTRLGAYPVAGHDDDGTPMVMLFL